MSDKNLKDMWSKADSLIEASGYESNIIERFTSRRSSSVSEKVLKMLQLDIGLKLITAFILVVDAIIYSNTGRVLAVCISGILLLIPLVLFEFNVLKRVRIIGDHGQNTREKLSGMLTFLRSGFFTSLLSISASYIFMFIAGMLMYFYAVYGKVRPLDGQDLIVFTVFIIIGIVFNFVVNNSQIKYHIRHLELCLTDLNDNVLGIIRNNIENERKQTRKTNLLMFLVLVLGILLLIAIFHKLGIVT